MSQAAASSDPAERAERAARRQRHPQLLGSFLRAPCQRRQALGARDRGPLSPSRPRDRACHQVSAVCGHPSARAPQRLAERLAPYTSATEQRANWSRQSVQRFQRQAFSSELSFKGGSTGPAIFGTPLPRSLSGHLAGSRLLLLRLLLLA